MNEVRRRRPALVVAITTLLLSGDLSGQILVRNSGGRWDVGDGYQAECWFGGKDSSGKATLTVFDSKSFKIEWNPPAYGFLHEVGRYGLNTMTDVCHADALATYSDFAMDRPDRPGEAAAPVRAGTTRPEAPEVLPDALLLRDYRPRPIHKIPVTEVRKAKFPAIDMHVHVYASTPQEILDWIKTKDEVGIEKSIVLTGATGDRFDRLAEMYGRHKDRFELWCGLDLSGFDKPGFGPAAVEELERCFRAGARGIGEISDKGSGLVRAQDIKSRMHPDDSRMDPIWQKAAELGMPVNLHVSDPIWAYQPMNRFNDGLMNAFRWRLDNRPDIVGHEGMIQILERTLQRHPKTIFVACHVANLDYDLTRLGKLLDTYPNLYVDLSARFGELAATPRASAAFITKHADRVVYGTDQQRAARMYRSSFRILETLDEHFYETDLYHYHWPLSGFGLSDETLRKIYRETPLKIVNRNR